jgi:hypothetical protein
MTTPEVQTGPTFRTLGGALIPFPPLTEDNIITMMGVLARAGVEANTLIVPEGTDELIANRICYSGLRPGGVKGLSPLHGMLRVRGGRQMVPGTWVLVDVPENRPKPRERG